MNAQAILDKILQDAKESASATLRDADDRAKEMEAAADKRIAAARAKTEAQARQDAEAATARMQRMAELDERKLLQQSATAAAAQMQKTNPPQLDVPKQDDFVSFYDRNNQHTNG